MRKPKTSLIVRNNVYYAIKPLVPLHVRLFIRRWFAIRKRRTVAHSWPFLPGSEHAPSGWTGWPNGKKFAFVLTHDVEGAAGVARCLRLAELEKELGFRSSFNFVPEGDYEVTADLREDLVRDGFEVGVHDLRHDGELYAGRQQFARNAARINHYLKKWGSVGFRGGFMFHNLEWLHDLDIQYDASTFDTDPFEPQPDGVGTIFPIWKAGPQGRGYVELPYTLPQDSTLFLLFRERGPDIWLRKLDWIASHGGMVLLNTHPDYMDFDCETTRGHEFPIRFYTELLEYLVKRYAGDYWTCLPRDLAQWYTNAIKPSLSRLLTAS